MALVVAATSIASNTSGQERVEVLKAGPGAGHFLSWHGKPILPVGDSVTQGWFESGRDFDDTAYLDAVAKSGQNTVMLWTFIGTNAQKQIADDRLRYNSPEVWPWMGSPDDKSFDLTRLNAEYFQRLRGFVEAADKRKLLVLITVFDGWTKRRFDGHPFNAALGNGPLAKNDQFVQLAHYGQPMPETFDPAWSWQEKNQYFQEQFALALIQAVGDMPNVIFEMFNEGEWYDPQLRLEHEKHFLNFFRVRTRAVLASNTDHIKLFSPHDNPDLDVVTLHNDWIGNFWIFQKGFESTPAKPYFQTEPVPEWNGREPTIEQIRRGVWERVLGGSGWVNQNDVSFGWNPHAPSAKLRKELLEAYGYAGHAAKFMHAYGLDFASMRPDSSVASSGIALVRPGSEYVAYAPHGGGWIWIDLGVTAPTAVELRWFNPRSGAYGNPSTQTISGITKLPTPDGKDWVLHLRLTPPATTDPSTDAR